MGGDKKRKPADKGTYVVHLAPATGNKCTPIPTAGQQQNGAPTDAGLGRTYVQLPCLGTPPSYDEVTGQE